MQKLNQLPAHEKILLVLLFLVVAVALTSYNSLRFYTLGTDSAGFVDLIRAVAESGTMVSAIFSSFYSVIPLLAATPDAYCTSDLLSMYREIDFLQWHPYFIAYILALPVKYLGVTALTISAAINAINISGSLALIYFFLRKNGLFVWECLSFIFAISITEYWVGTIIGQFYFDRLFILPGLVLVLMSYEKSIENYRVWLSIFFISMLGSILISERAALYASVLTLGYWLISKENRFERKGIAMLFLSVAGLIYLVIYMKFFQHSLYYDGLGWNAIKHNLSISLIPGGALFNQTMKWFATISPMVLLAFINWRYGLLVVAALIPNLLVSVGGAEKTGFTTHYHAGYIPFLVGFSAIGYATLVNKVKISNSSNINWIIKSYKSLLISIAVILSSLVCSQMMDTRQIYESIARVSPTIKNLGKQRNADIAFFAAIPTDQSISSPEWTMPTLAALGIGKVDYMPIGIGSNRYVIAQYISQSGLPEIPSYLAPPIKEQIADCIQNKLSTKYHIKSGGLFNGQRYIIYEKNSENEK